MSNNHHSSKKTGKDNSVTSKIAVFAEALKNQYPKPNEPHNCLDYQVTSFDHVVSCMVCGRELTEETMKLAFESRTEQEDKATSSDHNVGNGLYNSITPQQDFVSRSNPGVAMELNDSRAKDFAGKKVKPQLVDAYKSGNFAGKDWHVEQDLISGHRKFVFSRYDMPTLKLFKQVTEQYATYFGLDTVQKSHVSEGVRRIYSQLLMSEMPFWVAMAALYESGFLSEEQLDEVWKELEYSQEQIRMKIRTRCNKDLMKKERDAQKAAQKSVAEPPSVQQ